MGDTLTKRAAVEELVVQEFRLHVPDHSHDAARIVAAFAGEIPLLTSIDDSCDVATVKAIRAGDRDGSTAEHAALDPFVAAWHPKASYAPRITESAERPPDHYRLAVTGSGINDVGTQALGAMPRSSEDSRTPVGLLWIGSPIGTYAGLMVLVGGYDDADGPRADAGDWPMHLSEQLGVRIYEAAR